MCVLPRFRVVWGGKLLLIYVALCLHCFCGDPYVALAAAAAYFAAAIGLKSLLLMGDVAAYLGRGYVVW